MPFLPRPFSSLPFVQRSALRTQRFSLIEVLIGMALAILLLSTLSYFYQQVEWLNSEAERTQKESFQMRYVENRLAKIFPQTLSEREMKKHFYFYTSQADGLLKTPSLLFTYYNGVNLESPFANDVLGRLYLDEQKKQLCLATLPAPKRWKMGETLPMAKEVLLDNVESLTFEFYVAPNRNRSRVVDKKQSAAEKKKEEQEEKARKDLQAKAGQKPDLKQALAKDSKQDPAKQKQELNPEPEQGLIHEEELQPKGPWSTEWSHDYHHLPAMIKIHVKRKIQDEDKSMTFAFPLSYSQKVVVYEENPS